MKKVFICSARNGDPALDAARAQNFLLQAMHQDYAPFAPHLLYPQVLDEDRERGLGLMCALAFLQVCDELWVFGEPTNGMQTEIAMALELKIPVKRHPLEEVQNEMFSFN